MEPTRLSLLKRIQDPRDSSSWTLFVDLYTPPVYRYCVRQGNLQDADAQDVTQQVFTRLTEVIHTYDPARGRFRCWLGTIVRHKIIDFQRREQRRGEVIDHLFVAGEEYPEDEILREELESHLFGEAVRSLPAEYRQVLDIWWSVKGKEGRREEWVVVAAEQLGISVGEVCKLKFKAWGQLREKLVELMEDSPRFLQE
jgi:RNA polymerase sigma factor (sigma-70 family)